MPGAETLQLRGVSDFGVLLIHGFKSSPFEMSFLADYLNERFNSTVIAPRLDSHGTDIRELNKSNWQDWVSSAEAAYSSLEAEVGSVIVIGMSMGGSIALRLAATRNPIGVITMGTPYQLVLKTRLAAIIRHFVDVYYDHQGPDIADLEMKKSAVRYSGIPMNAVCELRAMLNDMKERYASISCPVALAHGRHDHVIPNSNMKRLQHEIGSSVKDIQYFENSYHILPLDRDRVDVFNWCADVMMTHFGVAEFGIVK